MYLRSLAKSPKMTTNPKIPRQVENLRMKLIENLRTVLLKVLAVSPLLLLKSAVINRKILILPTLGNQRTMTLACQKPLPSLSKKF